MLKWLSGSRPKSPQHEVVTDDPLATIKVDRPLEIYAVSRVNPIFDEEEGERRRDSEVASPGKSASSGYGNSSECSSGGESTVLRDDALTVLEQNVGFVKSILVAASPRRAPLTTIPEGKVDYCIPRPVWPRQEPPQPDDVVLVYANENKDSSVSEIDVSSPVILREVVSSSQAQDALRKLSVTLSHSRHLTKMTRALSHTSGSSLGGSLRWVAPSSACSSSGFSDLSHTPAESPSSVRNAILYGTLRRVKGYEKLGETYSGAGVTQGDVHLKPKDEHFFYSERPDFTLDMPRAELLLQKIREAKQRRYWCRVITSLMGLVFFLLSVMAVSMLLTRGKRIFGPI